MAVRSDAGSGEKDSPYYEAHQAACVLWDDIVKAFGGNGNGRYNAWSLGFYGVIGGRYKRTIRLERTTLNSRNLFTSPERNVFKQTLITFESFDRFRSSFFIKKANDLTPFVKIINHNIQPLDDYPKYILNNRADKEKIERLVNILKTTLEGDTLNKIKYDLAKQQLIIDIREVLTDRNIIEDLLNFESNPSGLSN